jgi:hypothetical protein
MSRIYKQSPINELDFLYLCKEAVDLVKTEWQDREIIADRITQIWLKHSQDLPDRSKYVGGLFADLELPDGHIEEGSKAKSVHELWDELDHAVMYVIHTIETQPK